MSVMWGVLRPNNEAPSRPWPVELGTANYINTNAANDTLENLKSQPGRIILTHWLRPEIGEAANG